MRDLVSEALHWGFFSLTAAAFWFGLHFNSCWYR